MQTLRRGDIADTLFRRGQNCYWGWEERQDREGHTERAHHLLGYHREQVELGLTGNTRGWCTTPSSEVFPSEG